MDQEEFARLNVLQRNKEVRNLASFGGRDSLEGFATRSLHFPYRLSLGQGKKTAQVCGVCEPSEVLLILPREAGLRCYRGREVAAK